MYILNLVAFFTLHFSEVGLMVLACDLVITFKMTEKTAFNAKRRRPSVL